MARTSGGIIVPNAYANPIINGGFDIWQRGTSFSSLPNGTYTADRWAYGKIGAVVHDVLQSSDVPAIAALVPGTNYSAHLDVTTADSSIASSDCCFYEQRIEGYNFLPFAQKQFTVGFWVKDTITGPRYVAGINSGTNRTCVIQYTINSADTWEYKTVTFPASPSSGTWNYTTGVGLFLRWVLSAGTDFHTTAGAWQTGSYLSASDQVNSTSSTSNNFKIWGVTMNIGPTVAPYWPRLYADEFRLCQRYFEVLGGNTTLEGIATIMGYSTTQAAGTILFRVPKRTTPAISWSATSDFRVVNNSGTSTTTTSLSALNVGPLSYRQDTAIGSSTLTVAGAHEFLGATSAAKIYVSAEL